ncbi:MAG: carbohydrate kinase family protein [Candidatus Aminicenantales bacterium]
MGLFSGKGSETQSARSPIVGIGEILWDMFPDGPRLGGAPANCAYYASQLGQEGVIVSQVGEDLEGKKILSCLQAANLTTDYLSFDSKHPTGQALVQVDKAGKPTFEILREAAWDYLNLNSKTRNLASQAKAVVFGSLAQRSPISKRAICEFLTLTRKECWRIFDVNLRAPYYRAEEVADLVSKANVLKMNEEEMRIISHIFNKSEAKLKDYLFDAFPLEVIVITRGPEGSEIFSRSEAVRTKAPIVKVADTVGAGDAFTAAVAVGLLHQKSLVEIGYKANQIATFVCSQKGAWVALPPEILTW